MDYSCIDFPNTIRNGGFNGYGKSAASTSTTTATAKKSVDEIVSEVIAGKKKYGTTVFAIQKLNSSLIKNVNLIQVGWRIRVK